MVHSSLKVSLIDLIYVNKVDDIVYHGTLHRIDDNDGVLVCFDVMCKKQKNCVFDKNRKQFKIRYLAIRLLTEKRPTQFKPSHVGCFSFFCKRTVMDTHEKPRNLNMC